MKKLVFLNVYNKLRSIDKEIIFFLFLFFFFKYFSFGWSKLEVHGSFSRRNGSIYWRNEEIDNLQLSVSCAAGLSLTPVRSAWSQGEQTGEFGLVSLFNSLSIFVD